MRPRHKQLRHTLIALALTTATAHATTVIDNANGYTLNAQGDVVQFASLAFDDAGRILAVGTAADVGKKAPQARHVDMAGRTVLLITHQLGPLAGLVDEVAVLDEGRIVQRVSPAALAAVDGPYRALQDLLG